MAVETNVDNSMPDEHPDPSKCSRIQPEKIDRDPGSCKQICEFPINKQDEIQIVYLKESPYQPKNVDYPYTTMILIVVDFNIHGSNRPPM